MNLKEEIIKGNPRALAKAISMVENNEDGYLNLLKEIFPNTGKASTIGITGAPGTGKSTLVDCILAYLRKINKSAAVIAIDPTSPFTGGAILGDRIRMMRHSTDDGVFIRSMATRGHLGGIAKSTGEVISIFDASGKDFIIVETVGVGQDEVEIVKLSDLVIVVLTPGEGDEIQTFKAGIMEIGDIFVLNKADHPDSTRMESQLIATLSIGGKGEVPEVVKTVAIKEEGVKELMEKTLSLLQKIKQSRKAEEKRKRFLRWMLEDIIKEESFRKLTQNLSEKEFDEYVEKIYKRELDPFSIAEKILNKG
ncbi:MAG: methylmalonyl Co-A mutase-associated GTPase MeaB [Acidobacteriota bacterium]